MKNIWTVTYDVFNRNLFLEGSNLKLRRKTGSSWITLKKLATLQSVLWWPMSKKEFNITSSKFQTFITPKLLTKSLLVWYLKIKFIKKTKLFVKIGYLYSKIVQFGTILIWRWPLKHFVLLNANWLKKIQFLVEWLFSFFMGQFSD